ncbi:aldo/keto reductase [Actinokineospora soli]|uniref:Aldo/keto reductase n=1 Tax=Actinokineospora soli TaxID=1048753 RepID=A0ABW2TNG6_9PSEU
MEQRHLGRSGLRVSRLALGTMTWGRDTDAEAAAGQLAAFTEAGGTLVDTADVYSDGDSERLLGALVDDVVPRDHLVIATKAVARRHDGPFGGGASRGALLAALEASLTRLDTDHVDLWQLHAWDAHVPLEETLCAIDAAVRSGKVRYAGISNYSGWQTATAATRQALTPGAAPWSAPRSSTPSWNAASNARSSPPPPTTASASSPGPPRPRRPDRQVPRQHPRRLPRRLPHWGNYVEQHRTDRAARIVQAVTTAADGLGTSPLAVALAWVRDRPGVAAPVIGARDTTQVRGWLTAESLVLPPEICAALDDVSKPDLSYPERHLD